MSCSPGLCDICGQWDEESFLCAGCRHRLCWECDKSHTCEFDGADLPKSVAQVPFDLFGEPKPPGVLTKEMSDEFLRKLDEHQRIQ